MPLVPNLPPVPPVIRPDEVFRHVNEVTTLAHYFLNFLHTTLEQLAEASTFIETPNFRAPNTPELPRIPDFPDPSFPSMVPVEGLLSIQPPIAPQLNFERPEFPSASFSEPTSPGVNFPSTPSLAGIPPTPSAPTIHIPVSPSAPNVSLPPVPTLEELHIPSVPSITLPSAPTINLTVDENAILGSLNSFDYLSLFNTVKNALPNCREIQGLVAKIEEMLLGGTGLPASVEHQILDRAIQKVETEGLRARAQAFTEWASRGFSMPGAALMSALAEIQNKTLEQKQQQIRENTIYIHEKYLESLRFAIQQGVTLQGVYFDHCYQVLQLCHTAVSNVLDVARTIANLRLDILRAKISVLQAQIEVFRAAIQEQLSHLDLYRGQLEAERLRGELNEQKVRLYVQQLQAVTTSVEIFRAQVAAYEASIRGELSKLDLFRSQIDANTQIINQNQAAISLYETQVRAEANKTSIFQAQVQAFEAKVRAYQAQVQGELSRIQALQSAEELKLRQYETQVTTYGKQIDAAVSKINALIANFNAQLEAIRIKAAAYTAKVEGVSRQSQQLLEQTRIEGELSIRNAELLLTKFKTQAELTLEKLRSLAQYEAQVGAAALAAVNASIGHHMQESIVGGTNVHINYESDLNV